jgi:predicted AAA+ superfamily ATPase
MVQQSVIQQVIDAQKQKIQIQSFGLERNILSTLPDIRTHALIVSGIRRCGKSTLLLQLLQRDKQKTLYLNFEDPRLINFELADFQLLDNIIVDSKCDVLFFDEIQVIEHWELYVRQKLDEGFKIVITGSNASLLSRELGTKLTGRHITKELFPFSYQEFLSFKSLQPDVHSLQKYMDIGGFPEYVKTKNTDVLDALFQDILNRDIVVRYGIRDVRALKRLAGYLISNVGNLVTANKLQQPLGVKTNTILEYFSYLEDSYLVNFMPKFSYSLRVQSVNPRKIYVIDPGIVKIASNSFTKDLGHSLENMVYWYLRQSGKEIYYFNENGHECDFVVIKNGEIDQLIQVCYELTPENKEREQRGLQEAMDFFHTDKGLIVTYNQKDAYMQNGKQIAVLPAYEYLTERFSLISALHNL